MSTVHLGRNRFVDCESILAYKGTPVLAVRTEPLRVALATPAGITTVQSVRIDEAGWSPKNRLRVIATAQSFAAIWDEYALLMAIVSDPDTTHLRLDLRPVGIAIYDDFDGLHIGQNVFSGNVVSNSAAAINLSD